MEQRRKYTPVRGRSIKDRFWTKVRIGGLDDCWPWLAGIHPAGHGMFDKQYAHRFAWAYTHGPIPKGLCICHHCDNPPCCNPRHLFIGTQADNVRDMWNKGRGQRYRARLTSECVTEIRRAHATGQFAKWSDLGRQFGIEGGHAQQIVLRQIWRHVA